jgi:hypothetical protein
MPTKPEGLEYMKKKAVLSSLLLSTLMTACAPYYQVPVPENFERTSAKKLRSSRHWEIVAQDVAAQTRLVYAKQPEMASRPVYVVLNKDDHTDFGRAFRTFLVSSLVEAGVPVMDAPRPGALEVRYVTQVVKHPSPRPSYRPGTLTALAAGVLVIHGLAEHGSDSAQAIGALGLAGAADVAAAGYAGEATNTEFIVNTSILDGDRYVISKSDVYYLENEDAPLFENPTPTPVKTWKVTGQ